MHVDAANLEPAVGGAAAKLRIQLTYGWRHGRLANLAAPTRFTELVQDRKLYDRDPRMPALADKLAVKAEVSERLGPDWVIPTLWSGSDLPALPIRCAPFVVKSRHGCNQTAWVRDADADWPAIRRRARSWVAGRYGFWLDEWLYRHIPRGILAEPFIGSCGKLPIDYKIYVFGGQAWFVQAHVDREHRHRWVVHDRDWQRLDDGPAMLPRPSALPDMIAAAEEMGRNFDFVRVDFYQPGSKPLFGEMSFYPGSGLDPFDAPGLDVRMGTLWLEARRRLTARADGPPAKAFRPVLALA